jgi:hypothetical protein
MHLKKHKPTKKAAEPTKGTAAYNPQITPARAYSSLFLIRYGMPYGTREHSTNYQLQAGFLTCVLPKESFPSLRDSGTTRQRRVNFFRSPEHIGISAYSGATVTDFNRVPFPVTRY